MSEKDFVYGFVLAARSSGIYVDAPTLVKQAREAWKAIQDEFNGERDD